jgi:hypothetical protein
LPAAAALDFIARVERGEVGSNAAFRAALGGGQLEDGQAAKKSRRRSATAVTTISQTNLVISRSP